jgi:hypothetical protein
MLQILCNIYIIFIALTLFEIGECRIKLIADDVFLDDCLYAHNKYRDLHENTERLTLHRNATDYAIDRVRTLAKLEGGYPISALVRVVYGENFYWYYDPKGYHSCEDAVDLWYKGIQQYSYNRPGFTDKSGGFSQLVWRQSKYLGCARVEDDTRGYFETYIVCNYHPAGNVEGMYPYNVYPPKDKNSQRPGGGGGGGGGAGNVRPDRDRPDKDRPDQDRPDRDRPDWDRPDRDRPDRDRPDRDRPDRDRPDRDRPDKDHPDRDRPDLNRPDRDRPDRDRPDRDRPDRDRPDRDRPDLNRPDRDRPNREWERPNRRPVVRPQLPGYTKSENDSDSSDSK